MIRWILPVFLLISQMSFALENIVGITADTVAASPTAAVEASSPDATVVESAAATRALKETDIPVHLEAAKKASSGDSPWMRMLGGLAVVGILAIGSWIFVKKSKTANRTSSLAPEIKVLSQHYLGPKKSLAIIRVAGESILLGITENNINLIKSLSLLDEEIPETVPSNFDSVFANSNSFAVQESQNLDEDESFSISGIKDVVTTRLKNMRTFQ